MRACVRVSVRACVRACVCVCARARVCVWQEGGGCCVGDRVIVFGCEIRTVT